MIKKKEGLTVWTVATLEAVALVSHQAAGSDAV